MENNNFENVERKAKRYNQEHLINYYNEIKDPKIKNKFKEQLENLNFELIDNLYKKTTLEKKEEQCDIEPINYWDKERLGGKYDFYEMIGKEAIKDKKLAAVTMAGGQGTRLGHDGPKGTIDIGLDSHKCLFELLCDGLKEAEKKYGVAIPWYIMTSEENDVQTREHFKNNKYFGYEKNVHFFVQGQLPMVDTEGKILIGENGLIKEAADGHGGVYESLVKSGMLEDMKKQGVQWVFIGGVDNCLVKMVDPILMGLAIYRGVTGAGKSVVKAYPQEKVGAFCRKNGRPNVIEYSEISPEMAEARDATGELLYGESHILCNLFNVSAIERMGSNPLPYHCAFKKATFIDKNGNVIKPNSPNAYKFEAFLFDAFGDLDDMAILRVKREEEFAPVKNATGVDSPETARELYNNLHKKIDFNM